MSKGASNVYVVTISGTDINGRPVEIKPILDALGDSVAGYSWAVTQLECSGAETADVCMSVERARRHKEGIWLAAGEIDALASRIVQTVEATLVAFPKDDLDPSELERAAFGLRFHESRAILMIEVSDNTYFTVLTKDEKHVEGIRALFRDLRNEDPGLFLRV